MDKTPEFLTEVMFGTSEVLQLWSRGPSLLLYTALSCSRKIRSRARDGRGGRRGRRHGGVKQNHFRSLWEPEPISQHYNKYKSTSRQWIRITNRPPPKPGIDHGHRPIRRPNHPQMNYRYSIHPQRVRSVSLSAPFRPLKLRMTSCVAS